jgi:hypothetical protein
MGIIQGTKDFLGGFQETVAADRETTPRPLSMGCVRHSGCRPFGFDLGSDCYNSMKGGTDNKIDLEGLRTHPRKMNDQELRRLGWRLTSCVRWGRISESPRKAAASDIYHST